MKNEDSNHLSKKMYHGNHELGVVVAGKAHQNSRSCKSKKQLFSVDSSCVFSY